MKRPTDRTKEPWLQVDHGSEARAMQRRVARGLTWTMVDVWGRQGLNLVVFVVLARLLAPVDFGLVALAAVFVTFAQLLVDQGMGDAIIQRRTVTRSHIDTAFWVALATGGSLTVIGLLSAGPISAILNESDLEPILQILSLTFILSAFSTIQIALLRRSLAFRSLAMRALVATSVGGVVGVMAAVQGFGAWALVAQQIATAVASVLTLWQVTAWRPRLHFARDEFRELFSFGINVVGSDALNFLSRNADNLLIGYFLGPVQLGLYAVGYRILTVSQTILISIARKIAFPALSRLQGNPERMVTAYLRLTRAISAVILPGYITLALVAPELTVVVFGPTWSKSGFVASVLFLIGPVVAIQAFADSMLNASGHPEVVFRIRLITAIVGVTGFLLAVQYGIVAVGASYVVRGYLLVPFLLRWMQRYAGVPALPYLSQLRGVGAATLALAAVIVGVKLALGGPLSPAALLAAEIVAGVPVFLVVLSIVERKLVGELLVVMGQAVPIGRLRRAKREDKVSATESEPSEP